MTESTIIQHITETCPGVNIVTAIPGVGYGPISGTSAAAAFVTGGIALLWSEAPATPAREMITRVVGSGPLKHRSIVPPLFDVQAARQDQRQPTIRSEAHMIDDNTERETVQSLAETPIPVRQPEIGGQAQAMAVTARSPRRSVVAQGGSCPTCAAGAQENSGPLTFVYAIGMIRTRFPSPSIEKEFAQVIAVESTASLTDQATLHKVLQENRYLANEVCWTFSVENTDAYILVPRDSTVLDKLVEAVKPSQRGIDTDVIIGTRGPMAPAEMCNGFAAPIVLVDQIYSFDKPQLLRAIKRPKELKITDEAFKPAAEELFDRIQQMGDNVGGTDEHRAINYLLVRYAGVYTHTADMFARDYSLTSLTVTPSRLSLNRKLYNVILSFTNRNTDVVEKFYVRVDVTDKFPFLDKKLSPYYERE
jgi:hypothetical protein